VLFGAVFDGVVDVNVNKVGDIDVDVEVVADPPGVVFIASVVAFVLTSVVLELVVVVVVAVLLKPAIEVVVAVVLEL
jgi:hypothetical protein